MRRRWITLGRPVVEKQAELPFLERSRRLDRAFKAAIAASTLLFLTAVIGGTSTGRRLAAKVPFSIKSSVARSMGMTPDRTEFEANRHGDRMQQVEAARESLARVAERGGATLRAFLRVARLDADSAVIRWGNFDRTLALSSAVFEPDETGRSYRLLPNTRSIWVNGMTINGVLAMFQVPDTPEARRLGMAVGGKIRPEWVQTTNSWGCRGPEPDPTAPVRGLVLGDSNMQGLLVADDQTPPVRLAATLREDLGVPVSILNTGHLGYSPEQYYSSLIAYFDRFRPQFVVISLCANDFGDMTVAENWREGEYWMDLIAQFCRARSVQYLFVPLPVAITLIGERDELPYPGKISSIVDGSAMEYLNPIEEFSDAHLRLKAEALREGRPYQHSPLFNLKDDDHHLSALGCDLWARVVARRLELDWLVRNPGGIGPIPPKG